MGYLRFRFPQHETFTSEIFYFFEPFKHMFFACGLDLLNDHNVRRGMGASRPKRLLQVFQTFFERFLSQRWDVE